jgi:SepF-like predicted cell division protein (DUF552 family)
LRTSLSNDNLLEDIVQGIAEAQVVIVDITPVNKNFF